MSTINDSDLLLVERNGNLHQITYDQMSTLNDDDILLVERGGVQYKVEAQYVSTGANGLIIPPVEVLTPLNGSGITVFDQYEPLSSAITAVGEAGTILKDTDEIQSVVDLSIMDVGIYDPTAKGTNNSGSVSLVTPSNADINDVTFEPILSGQSFDPASNSNAPGYQPYVIVDMKSNVSGFSYTLTGSGMATLSLSVYSSTTGLSGSWGNGQTFVMSNNTSQTFNYSSSGRYFLLVRNSNNDYSGTGLNEIPGYSYGLMPFMISSTYSLSGAILSFPTNTNFGGLSVGDVVQGSGINVTGQVILYHWTQNISAGQEIYINGQKVALGASNSMQQLDITTEAGSSITSMEIHRTVTSGGAIAIAGISVDGNLITGEEFASGWDPNIVWEGAGGAEATFDGVVTTVGQTYTGLPVAPSLGGLAVNTWNASNMSNYAQITSIDADATPPTITVNGGTWDTSNQSQTWSSAITTPSNSFNSGQPAASAFDGDLATFAGAGSIGEDIVFQPTTPVSYSDSIEVYTAQAGQMILNSDSPVATTDATGWVTLVSGSSGSINTITIDPNSNRRATLHAIRVDGNLLVDAFEDSQVWSNLVVGTLDTQYGNSDVAVPFNGSTGSSYSDGIRGNAGQYLSMNFGTTFASATTVKIYGHASLDGVTYTGTNENLKINGTAIGASDWADNGGGSAQSSATFTLSNGLTSLEWGYSAGSQSSGYLYLQGIEVDGKLLVDAVENSQVWSNGLSGPDYPGYSVTNAFDGNTSTVAYAVIGNTSTVTLPGGPLTLDTTSSLRVWVSQRGTSSTFFVNGVDYTSQVGLAAQWYTITGETQVTSIGFANIDGSVYTGLYAVEVNGKLMVDAAVSGLGDRYLGSSISYEKALTFTDDTELANMVGPFEMTDANGDVVTPVSDTIASVSGNVLTLQGNTNLAYFQPGDEVQTGVEIVSVDTAAPSITVDGGEWLGADGTNTVKRISRSLRFDSADSAYLSRTPSTAGNRKTWTVSFWLKRGNLGSSNKHIFETTGSPEYTGLYTTSADQLEFRGYASGFNWVLTTSQVFRDPSVWYHIVLNFDSTASTASDRVAMYVDGEKVTNFISSTYPNLNHDSNWNNNVQHFIGAFYAGNSHWDGYVANIHSIDGLALAPTEFGEFDSNGVWQAKTYEGSHNNPDGQIYSGMLTSSSGFISSYPAVNAFDGNLSTFAWNNLNYDNYIEFTPTTPISFTNGVQVHCYAPNGYGITNYYSVDLDGNGLGSETTFTGGSSGFNSNAWIEVATGSGTLYKIRIRLTRNPSSGASSAQINAIAINGSGSSANYLVDGTPSVNGFHLDFEDNSSDAALGYDAAGSNDWTVNNLSVASGAANDSLVDVPANHGTDTGLGGEVRGNYATLNPLHPLATATLANGNLQTTSSNLAFSSILMTSGKWYVEHTVTTAAYNLCFSQIDHPSGASPSSSNSKSIGWYTNGTVYWGAGYDTTIATSYVAGDVLAAAIDMDNSTIKLYKNGNLETTIDFTSSNYHRFAEGMYVSQFSGTGHWNFGQRAWTYAPPSGYKVLCDTNLPPATIKDGSKHFDVVTYTGNGSTQTISGLGFSPDLVWIKCRDIDYSHNLYDSLRGHTNALYTNNTSEEVAETRYGYLSSFDSNGFTLSPGSNDNDNTHRSGTNYVAWCWNAGDTTETIAAGDLTSSAYDQSQTWSSSVASTTVGTPLGGKGLAQMFNANIENGESNYSYYESNDSNSTITFSPALTSTDGSNVKMYISAWQAGDGQGVEINGSAYTLTGVPGVGSAPKLFDLGTQSLSSISWTAPGGTNLRLNNPVVDGKILVDSGVSVSAVPSIGAEVRANPAAGFSIVKYTGDNAASGTLPHGLDTAPEFIIIKSINVADFWPVYHRALGTNHMKLNDSAGTGVDLFGSEPTSSVFSVGTGNEMNGNYDYIAYCFAPVEGYSAMGSYTGNGMTDGPFVNLNFKPAFVLIKGIHSISWHLFDNKREGYNVANDALLANHPNGEFSQVYLDLLSNGFKVRKSTNALNSPAITYVYIAFAENPVAQDAQTVTTGDTQVALDALVASATEIVETDGTTMYLNGATGPWRTGLSIEGSQINDAPPGPSEIIFTSQNQGTPAFSGVDATLASRTWTLESGTTATGPWTLVDTYSDFGVLNTQTGATPWTENKPTLQPNTYYRIKVQYDSTNAESVESVYNTFKTGDA
jgi:hypothetical protein